MVAGGVGQKGPERSTEMLKKHMGQSWTKGEQKSNSFFSSPFFKSKTFLFHSSPKYTSVLYCWSQNGGFTSQRRCFQFWRIL